MLVFSASLLLCCPIFVYSIENNPIEQPKEPIKYVVTYPAYFRPLKDFTFSLVLFETIHYSLPVTFTVTLTDRGDQTVTQQVFTQSKYGLEQHVFSKLRTVPAQIQQPSVSIKFAGNELGNSSGVAQQLDHLSEEFIFVQTDKALYKPSQTVHFRVLAINRETLPVVGKVSVAILDAKKNRIQMWENQRLERGLFGSSFMLSDFVNFGDWSIFVKIDNNSSPTVKTFAVKQYVLPKYEARLEFPNNYLLYSTNQSNYVGYVRAKHIYGKKIRGRADVFLVESCFDYRRYHRPYDKRPRQSPMTLRDVVLKGDGSSDDGRFFVDGLNRKLFHRVSGLKMTESSCRLTFKATVIEEITGETISSDPTEVFLYRDPYVVKLHDSVLKSVAKPGLPFPIRLQVTRPDDSPTEKQVNVLFQYSVDAQSGCDYYVDHSNSAVLATNKLGIASAVVDVPSDAKMIYLKAVIQDALETEICESIRVSQTESKDAISISIDRPSEIVGVMPRVGDSMRIEVRTTFAADYVYLLMTQNGQPFLYKKLDSPTGKTSLGTIFSAEVTLPREAAPRCSVVAWTVEKTLNKILADAVDLDVDGLVRQQVTASFSPATVAPGGFTTLSIQTSEPASTIVMFAVDKSVKLLRSGNDITAGDVIRTVTSQTNERRPWPYWSEETCADEVFHAAGMLLNSNVQTCNKYVTAIAYLGQKQTENEESSDKIDSVEVPKVRKPFPETWFWWTNTSSSANGELSQTIKAPDAITSWVLSAFAISEKNGFGSLDSKNPIELAVFRPFFVDIDIPYPTVIRNEEFVIKAVVHNYQPYRQLVNVTLKMSPLFEISSDDGDTYKSKMFETTVSISGNDEVSVPLWLRPLKLGEIILELEGVAIAAVGNSQLTSDAIQKTINVETEGEPRYANRPILLCREFSDDEPFETSIDIDAIFVKVDKSQVVEGSVFFQLQAIGDILGPALTQFGSRIRLPTGCGEQTLVVLAPNVYIYKYLKSVGELAPDLEEKTKSFVLQGYQRELTYQRRDGGFSAFGDKDSASSTWLTSFVIRSFNAASKHLNTLIDETVLRKAWNFLKNNANSSGTFKDPGRVINLAMKGSAKSEINLAAYVYMTYAEAGGHDKLAWSSLAKTREMLETIVTEDPYQLALIAYATSILPNDRHISAAALDHLLSIATRDADFIFWSSPTDGQNQVETVAYALLALCQHDLLGEATGVARWLISQRNSMGGFDSTQDTVVGLQALSEYASRMAGIERNMKITATMRFAGDDRPIYRNIVINRGNEMLLQSFDLPRNWHRLKSVDISVTGTGVALVQLAVRYNILTQRVMDSGDFGITVVADVNFRTKRSTTPHNYGDTFLYTCISAKSREAKVGMVVAEVGIPTGFTADLEGTIASNEITNWSSLKRIEAGDHKLVFYFDSLNSPGSTCVTSHALRGSEVKNVQRSVAKVYSYYEPSRTKSILYSFESLSLAMSPRRGFIVEGVVEAVFSAVDIVLNRIIGHWNEMV